MRYLVSWDFMGGTRARSFNDLVDAVIHAKIIIDGLKPVHVKIDMIPF